MSTCNLETRIKEKKQTNKQNNITQRNNETIRLVHSQTPSMQIEAFKWTLNLTKKKTIRTFIQGPYARQRGRTAL